VSPDDQLFSVLSHEDTESFGIARAAENQSRRRKQNEMNGEIKTETSRLPSIKR
jgi:hypothetical protein